MTFDEVLHIIQERGLEMSYVNIYASECDPCLIVSFGGDVWMNAFGENWGHWNGEKGLGITLNETEEPDLRWPFELLDGRCDLDGISNAIAYNLVKMRFDPSGGSIFEEKCVRLALKCVERMLS